ncbi:RNA polymerase sigma factor [Sunxiuqinia elliptica]|uniref:RNA polymerase sigma-70 factor (ECF subfamily) n=1 Tax=Sunxiuqinia elliptica TaxID=655355 RepID=A0A4R6H6R0_9BACT|nr:sigma-70 family RNA polymerase sigma factor [Sunxiuqinia elliptica]TDO03196.1 RNA polymerase sigma-70 factor (ECF subfamily) [Sunxiuqinia elliptica]TDO59393.1 RNA polymerase sigma-70 factor (ECF subfamily) [Sunxiuqinia elliptica]
MFESICKEKVFSAIYRDFSKDVHDYLYYKFGARADIEDTVQAVFIKLWDNCKKVALDKARAFLFRVAKNTMLNQLKHEKVVLEYERLPAKSYTNETPEFLLEEEQFLKKYQAALSKLTEEQRVVFLLNKVEGKKFQEIADLLGITKKVVEYRIYTAFKIIKSEVKEIEKF